ncbi:SDR family NAD(P)-dependent oxidoreductase [Achromobacter anxifer]|uniref:NADP-dependent 7-alpha-hydroxysteroid dehydrogenase n=1 Tax=Achromobacter anxifer TaxID=1287737 RepID=A0A6S7D8V5_9BURK|nr:SDR family oxidoreductase [Achromobacter anxifer]MDF8362961.1 SDR family oxidoreductase [Achromobacter anxifer]CAB3876541.1 NADP-dependent 7-alpha-hydroxysteroid dehydrogenase [Achromobacter anxifer]CAB5515411.1 NADP-dependent 7-alpha-hydroxysteroid dehydrogenase [Achromobacter anxifer]
MRLAGKIALVSGAGTLKKSFSAADQVGNGAACALRFAREGALVVCTDRVLEAAQETAGLIRAEGGRAAALALDVIDTPRIEEVVAEVIRNHGGIDILHNNVGIEIQGDLLQVKDDEWDQVMAVNVRGSMAMSRAVLPHMRARGGGAIINVSSTASLKWSPMQFLSYSTAKAGLNHMTRVIARQYAAEQIRCNCIVPGMIRTPHADALYSNQDEAAQGHEFRDSRCPMGRQGSPWDIANAALFLASDEAAYVTGAMLVVDGGASL